MDALEHIESRLAAVEAMVRSQPSVPDARPELKLLRDELAQVQANAETALARRIPSTASLVTRNELHESLRSMGKSMAEHVVNGEKTLNRTLTTKFDATVGEVHNDVQAAKNAAYASGLFAASMLLSKSSNFGR
jgi:hypothetical protein